jgi:hypothetical protein
MVSRVEELGAAVGVMCAADLMVVFRMRVPVETPTSVDVAVVRPPVDAHAREDPEQDPCIENAGVEPVSRPARVQPCPREETREKGHQTRKGPKVIKTPQPSPVSRGHASVKCLIDCGLFALTLRGRGVGRFVKSAIGGAAYGWLVNRPTGWPATSR